MFTLGGISFATFLLRFVVFKFHESPKYLLGRGKDEAALAVLHTIAKTNRVECHITMETFATLEAEARDNVSRHDQHAGTQFMGFAVGKPATLGQKLQAEFSRVRILFSTATLGRLTTLVWIIYAFDYWGFSVAGKSSSSASQSLTF